MNKPKDQIKILLVEDDPNFGSVLKNYLELNSYYVKLSTDGSSGLESFLSDTFDLCILDVMMPKKDGFTLAEEIRHQDKTTPIIFLTAKTMKDDMLRGFRTGADDYITKPFDSEVLLHKLSAILRRSAKGKAQFNENEFAIGKYNFHYDDRLIKSNGSEQRLSPKEAELLKLLCQHMGEILPRTKALKMIWGDDTYFNGRSMDVFITRLRKLFKDDPAIDIINIHGKGFRMMVKNIS
jgi:DNA-binding response OmpR family regulator